MTANPPRCWPFALRATNSRGEPVTRPAGTDTVREQPRLPEPAD